MKNKKIHIIANWKMNPPTLKKAEQIFLDVLSNLPQKRNIKLILCPPFVWLPNLILKYQNMGGLQHRNKIVFGVQNIFWEKEKGAFTGEISAAMVKNLGGKYVIIGHSERREYFNETDEIVNRKLKAAFDYKLNPILCIGEKERERDEFGRAVLPTKIIQNQLEIALKDVSKNNIKSLIIAYEPRWAIGTGFADSPENTFETTLFIKRILTQMFTKKIAQKIAILYGGSVNAINAPLFLKRGGVDGLLIGGASLNSKEFIKILQLV